MTRPLLVPRAATLAVTATAALLLTAGLAASASPTPGGAPDAASASDLRRATSDPVAGQFRRAGAPVYAEAPDGWACHYRGTDDRDVDGRCTFPQRRAVSGPPPAWRSTSAGEPVGEVTCRRGFFLLIRSDRGRGWVAQDDVQRRSDRSDGPPPVRGCSAVEWS
jgi:hypothetical protein